ncbi:MAG: hypothetical protein RMY16_13265 [Nostoc sp. DedQUE12b]|uniref:hypothetical protein n=1 Tax=Nostoc sp. DedQUE12b TaxID=3075398 RepID=UPI002AD2ECD1|nr:hypothetical protein [Nostoc sp. DedQUE12b]MDZ8086508.1 hypothetical protein [Nostoc sp. DedQUE12b]
MVAQFPITPTTPAKNLTPQIKVDVLTFTEAILLVTELGMPRHYRMCAIDIAISNVNKNLAVGTFSRVFAYAQSLANNDINPTPNVNANPVEASANLLQAKPTTGITLSIDSTEIISVCALTLSIANLRLDYMDEYFNSTLTYLTNAIASDLNPST